MCKNMSINNEKRNIILMAVGMIIITVTMLAMILCLTLLEESIEDAQTKLILVTDTDANREATIISRMEWVATDSKLVTPLNHPINKVIIFQTRTESCVEKKVCIKYVRHLQNNHMEILNDSDISYNFLIGGDANVYNGRGWYAASANVPHCNKRSITIALIGSYQTKPPSKEQLLSLKQLITHGLKKGYIRRNFRIVAASQALGDITSTGQALLSEIKKWAEWASIDLSRKSKIKTLFCDGP